MEFRKMVTITLYEKQKKRHRCTEQTFFSWVPKSLQMVTAAMKLKDAWSFEEKV